jgi:glucose-1-phosphate thymidylyltransferase
VQTEPGGIAQVVGMAESFSGGGKLVVCLGDNLFEYAEVSAIRSWVEGGQGAQIFVKDVPDPERFGVVVYAEDGRVSDVVEKAGIVDTRYDAPPTADAVVGLYCYDGDVYEIIRGLEPSSRGELEITDVNRRYAERGRLGVTRVRGWWHDAGAHEALAELGALVEETGANKLA